MSDVTVVLNSPIDVTVQVEVAKQVTAVIASPVQVSVATVGVQGPPGPQGGNGLPGPQGPAGAGLTAGGTTGQVLSKNSATDNDTSWATLTKGSVGLSNVDNTSDANKPVSAATQTALNAKASVADSIINAIIFGG